MAYRALFGVAAAAVLSTACDISQKTPETGSSFPTTTAIARPAATGPAAVAAEPSPETVGEKSIRLFGPGVSRKRQTRV